MVGLFILASFIWIEWSETWVLDVWAQGSLNCKFLAISLEWDFFFSEEADFKCHVLSILRDLAGAVTATKGYYLLMLVLTSKS